jgi:rfaE bifunctional protein nucleotidyltransferase chain/domain
MNKIIPIQEVLKLSQKIKKENKTIVLCGGCFDILHIGHIQFLENAKRQGDYLFILLESDQSVKKIKGKNRPINLQSDRAEILSSINFVDYIILLNEIKTNKDYDKLVFDLKPDIIAITKNNEKEIHVQRQAKKINAKVVDVITRIKDKSTTRLAGLIAKNF